MDDIRVVQVDDGECEIYEGNFDDDDEDEEEMVEAETTREEEAGRDNTDSEVVCDVVEIEVGDDHMEIEEMEEEKEEAAGVETEEVADCEANTDKSIREGSDSTEPTDEVVTNTK